MSLSFSVMADEEKEQPKSPAAVAALNTYRHAYIAANQQLLRDLSEAKRQALRSENLREAMAIDSIMQETEKNLSVFIRPSTAPVAMLNINGHWKMKMKDGQRVDILIKGDTITHVPTHDVATFTRKGNEIRVTWPKSGYADKYVFDEDTVKSEYWAVGRKPYVGTPTGASTGERVQP
jgi:hypothetical protein